MFRQQPKQQRPTRSSPSASAAPARSRCVQGERFKYVALAVLMLGAAVGVYRFARLFVLAREYQGSFEASRCHLTAAESTQVSSVVRVFGKPYTLVPAVSCRVSIEVEDACANGQSPPCWGPPAASFLDAGGRALLTFPFAGDSLSDYTHQCSAEVPQAAAGDGFACTFAPDRGAGDSEWAIYATTMDELTPGWVSLTQFALDSPCFEVSAFAIALLWLWVVGYLLAAFCGSACKSAGSSAAAAAGEPLLAAWHPEGGDLTPPRKE